MKVLFVTAIVAVIGINCQLSIIKDQECKENETFQTCGTACEPSCDRPNPTFCTLQCVVGCQCNQGFVRNSLGNCVKPDECRKPLISQAPDNCAENEEATNCFNPCSEPTCKAPDANMVCTEMCKTGCTCKKGFKRDAQNKCVPEAECPKDASPQNRCGANETFSDCHNSCTEPKCTESGNVACPAICMQGCSCNQGYKRNDQGECVLEQDCAPKFVPRTCSMMLCRNGFVCKMVDGRGTCVPTSDNKPTTTCASVKCTANTQCAMVVPTSGGAKQPMCIEQNACSVVDCPNGQQCELKEVNCIKAPCHPVADCVGEWKCGKNQQFTNCYNKCMDAKCGQKNMMCNRMCEGQGCTCKPGFFRNNANECVTEDQCQDHPDEKPSEALPNCSTNETFIDCHNSCSESKCDGSQKHMMCSKQCHPGCHCKDGYQRSFDGNCYKDDCPDIVCKNDEQFGCVECEATCEEKEKKCDNNPRTCRKGCRCAEGFVRKNGKCVTMDRCPKQDNCLGSELFVECLPRCEQSCTGHQTCNDSINEQTCTPGCICRPRYKRNSKGKCVHNRKCFKSTKCPKHEQWSKCLDDDQLCSEMAEAKNFDLHEECYSGCICEPGFQRNSTQACVPSNKC